MRRVTKTELRQQRRQKARYAPRGGTAGAQIALLKTQREYKGSAKKFIVKKAK